MIKILIASLAVLFALSANAFTVDTPLKDPYAEARAQQLFMQVRCVVCQGQSLADSAAEIAVDMRKEIRRQLQDGQSEEEILQFLTQRYGDTILMRPALSQRTVPLWFAPVMFLTLAGGIATFYFKKRSA